MSSQCAVSQVFSFYLKGQRLCLHVYAIRLAASQPANGSAVERGPAANLVLVNDRLLLLLLRFFRQLELHQHVGHGVAPKGHGRPARGGGDRLGVQNPLTYHPDLDSGEIPFTVCIRNPAMVPLISVTRCSLSVTLARLLNCNYTFIHPQAIQKTRQ